MTVNADNVIFAPKFIRLHKKKHINLVAIHPQSGDIKGITRPYDSTDLDQFIFDNNGKYNLYHTVNEPHANAPDGKLTKSDIKFIHALFIDADPDKKKPFNQERTRLLKFAADLQTYKLPPTYTVDSGGGVNAYWYFDQPLSAENYQEQVEDLGRGLAKDFNTDAVQNIDRLMRLPYTTNLPTKNKPNRPITFAQVPYSTKSTYPAEKLLHITNPVKAQQNDTVTDDEPLDMTILDKIPAEVLERWKNIKTNDEHIKGIYASQLPSRSEYDMALISRLKDLGWSLQDTAYIVHRFTLGKGVEMPRRELIRCYNRAASKMLTLAVNNADQIMEQPNPYITAKQLEHERNKPKRKYKAAGELSWKKTSIPLFKHLIDRGTIVALYGQSNVGKSFAAIDLAAHLAAGKDWANYKLKGGHQPLLYIAAEAGNTIGKRIDAVKRRIGVKHDVPLYEFPFAVYSDPINLLETNKETGICKGVEELVHQVQFLHEDTDIKPAMIVIDTLSAVMAGGNENSSDDMGQIVTNLLNLAHRTGCVIVIVHHSGKDQAAGLRGHTKLIGAMDSSFEVKIATIAGRDKRTIVARKQRDNEKGVDIDFNLNVLELGKDEDGDVVTSCHLFLDTDPEFEPIIPHIIEQLDHDDALILVSILLSNAIADSDTSIKENLNNYSISFYTQLLNCDKTTEQLTTIYNDVMKGECNINDEYLGTNGLSPRYIRMKQDGTIYKRFIRGGDNLGTKGVVLKNLKKQYVIEKGDRGDNEGTN